MLEFNDSFFQGETIDGFYVESEMKRAWAAQMEVLMEIERICNKYNIQYYAAAGTMLGAVRHKGFIPWDDDLDISMKRADYQRFMKVAPKEIPYQWHLYSPQLDKGWKMPFMRLINNMGINISSKFLQQFHGCPYGVGVDIFALDYLPSDKTELEVLKILYEHTLYVKQIIEKGSTELTEEEYQNKIEEFLLEVEETLRFKINRKENIVNQMLVRLEEMSMLYQEEESKQLGCICFMSPGDSKGVLKEWYQEAVLLPFENIMIPVPKGYDEVLRVSFGDYMIPVRGASAHSYPFYKNQRKQVEEMVDKLHEIDKKITKLEEIV